MFTSINIKNFRAIQNKEIQLGKYVTMLAGWNSTGKSTVLALLANSTELKPQKGKSYNGKPLRAEFGEILKGSKTFDTTAADRLEIIWEKDGKRIIKNFRTGWQNENGKERFRVIPKELNEHGKIKNEAKFELPVIYLGLSRLFPIGESDENSIEEKAQLFNSDEDKEWFIQNHQELLGTNDSITNLTNINFQTISKNSLGIDTDCYDWKTNSSGQDNISQILFAILSFRKLHKTNPEINGGLLIIDELEAALHPKAQEKIINLLVKESKSNRFQVVFTTHSFSIIESFINKKKSNDGTIVYHYFSRANDQVEIKQDISFQEIKEDLLLTPYHKPSIPKIIIYTEDEEARWFLKKLLRYRIHREKYKLLNVNISCNSLIDLMNCDPSFTNYLVVFDGDLPPSSIKRIKKNKNNYLLLPTNRNSSGNAEKESPERCLENFIFSQKGKKYLQEGHKKIPQVKREFFNEYRIDSCNGDHGREKSKVWFQLHKELFEKSKIFDYWKAENEETINIFIKEFIKIFNKIAENVSAEKI